MRYRLLCFNGVKSTRLAEADDVTRLLPMLRAQVTDIIRGGGFCEYVIMDTENDTVYYRVKTGD